MINSFGSQVQVSTTGLLLVFLFIDHSTAFHSFSKLHNEVLQLSKVSRPRKITTKTSLQQNNVPLYADNDAPLPFFAKVIDEQKQKEKQEEEKDSDANYISMFDFSTKEKAEKSITCFERIDDAIMGGISTSTLMIPTATNTIEDNNSYYASWSGICRTDGGGFCGFRTLPFKEPYYPSFSTNNNNTNIKEIDGIYAKMKFISDNEPHRRIWKFTTRTDTSRGEQVYQAEFILPPLAKDGDYHTIKIPFQNFKVVRGPRMIENSPPIDISTNGIYQIGMTCSKFIMAKNTTELENFRDGYFNVHFQDIGLYYSQNQEKLELPPSNNLTSPQTLSSKEAKKKQPILFKILRPIFSLLLFSEQSNRRKSALKILMMKRNMSRWNAIVLGIKYRTKSLGFIKGGILKTSSIIGIDSIRFMFGNIVKYFLVKPLFFILKIVHMVLGKNKK